MSMFDDLRPDFTSSPGAALPMVAARVHAMRKRRLITVSAVCGTIVAVLFTSMAFASGGDGAHRVTVATDVTTTTDDAPSTSTLTTEPSTTTSSTTTAPETTTSTPVAPPPTDSTTTVPQPAHLIVTFDRDRLVIQSGTSETITYTVTNDGDEAGEWGYTDSGCVPVETVWPDDQSTVDPILWPVPVAPEVVCLPLRIIGVPAHGSQTLPVVIGAGRRDDAYPHNNLVPAPPGETSYSVRNFVQGGGEGSLPVTITPPATPPLTVSHPSSVTTASGAQHFVNFTITNHLPFPVRFVEQGPCSPDGDAPCRGTVPGGGTPGDMREPPYASAVKPLYTTAFILAAHETRTVRAAVHGTTTMEDINQGSPDMPPGVYYFDWDGEKVKFTVTP